MDPGTHYSSWTPEKSRFEPWNPALEIEGVRDTQVTYPQRSAGARSHWLTGARGASLPISAFSDVALSAEMGHRENIHTTENGKHYKSGGFPLPPPHPAGVIPSPFTVSILKPFLAQHLSEANLEMRIYSQVVY